MTLTKSSLVLLTADAFLNEFGLESFRDLEGTAARLGLQVREVNATSFDGALVRVIGHPVGTVVIRSSIRETARKRFTLAHELGHYLLPNQQGLAASPCAGKVIESWRSGLDDKEIDANQFAAEILMPRRLMVDQLSSTPSLEIASQIGDVFGTSLTASLFRLAELSSHRMAMVVSDRTRVRWYRASDEFGRAVEVGALDNRTLAYALIGEHSSSSGESGYVPADAWLYEQNLQVGAQVWEQSVYLRSYGLVLTLLEIRERIEIRTDYDEENGDPLEPEEFTVRRRRWPR